ncbi:hypothetical protein [Clostridium tagluense]|uniref:hypothetical protein n=1 Tax=Clostridium tagluense TaxID=360422 RepID=UPI001CF450A4|nr:hypothetical protein [Clostridium tagluense]MCB2300642.1 hypothetical protein [Clostridium tagluense]
MMKVEFKTIDDALNKSGVKKICPFCEKNDFRMNNTVSSTVPMGEGRSYEFITGVNTPVIEVICNNCGYVAHFAIPTK